MVPPDAQARQRAQQPVRAVARRDAVQLGRLRVGRAVQLRRVALGLRMRLCGYGRGGDRVDGAARGVQGVRRRPLRGHGARVHVQQDTAQRDGRVGVVRVVQQRLLEVPERVVRGCTREAKGTALLDAYVRALAHEL